MHRVIVTIITRFIYYVLRYHARCTRIGALRTSSCLSLSRKSCVPSATLSESKRQKNICVCVCTRQVIYSIRCSNARTRFQSILSRLRADDVGTYARIGPLIAALKLLIKVCFESTELRSPYVLSRILHVRKYIYIYI